MIKLNSPMVMTPAAARIRPVSITWSAEGIRFNFAWLDASGGIIKQDSRLIVGADFGGIDGIIITADMAGKNLSGALLLAIEEKVRTMMQLQGVADGQFI